MTGPHLVHALIVHTDGRFSEHQVRDDLETMQSHVGGYIELISLGPGAAAYCNENGLLDGLPYNDLATRAVAQLRPDMATPLAAYGIRGDVVFLGTTPAGNHRDCPRRIADLLRTAAASRQGEPL